jgi:hypothetical protein
MAEEQRKLAVKAAKAKTLVGRLRRTLDAIDIKAERFAKRKSGSISVDCRRTTSRAAALVTSWAPTAYIRGGIASLIPSEPPRTHPRCR